jgi:hypothetical protein
MTQSYLHGDRSEQPSWGCYLYDAVAAEADLERHGVRPGGGLKTLGRDKTGLRI